MGDVAGAWIPRAALVLGLGLALLPAACDDSAVEGTVAPGNDLAPRVIAFCEANLSRLDCPCFWKNAAPAFNAGNVDPVMQILAERDQHGPMITRGRLERYAGEEETRRLGRALYDCVDLTKK